MIHASNPRGDRVAADVVAVVLRLEPRPAELRRSTRARISPFSPRLAYSFFASQTSALAGSGSGRRMYATPTPGLRGRAAPLLIGVDAPALDVQLIPLPWSCDVSFDDFDDLGVIKAGKIRQRLVLDQARGRDGLDLAARGH